MQPKEDKSTNRTARPRKATLTSRVAIPLIC